MGYVQPLTPTMTDNSTTYGIINGNMKQHRMHTIDMRFYWVCNQCIQNHLMVYWSPSKNNLGDYYTKYHPAVHHMYIRNVYLYVASPVLHATSVTTTSSLQGCVEMGKNTQDKSFSKISPNSLTAVWKKTKN
eukprot:14383730-Ditylum_brightwellii.AAC.2